ncbi:MAG: hypothetical protein BWY11_00790 [Firmicutes bacterium ADurb.Bin182]|nr:MAG: hypothetical protein BWY11_00790 [Firmicutes bacterium ADurb.Bin182]
MLAEELACGDPQENEECDCHNEIVRDDFGAQKRLIDLYGRSYREQVYASADIGSCQYTGHLIKIGNCVPQSEERNYRAQYSSYGADIEREKRLSGIFEYFFEVRPE